MCDRSDKLAQQSKEIRATVNQMAYSRVLDVSKFLALTSPPRCLHCQNACRVLLENKMLKVLCDIVIAYSVFLEIDCDSKYEFKLK